MKTIINIKGRRRILTTVLMLTMILSINYGQGLLAESAIKLFRSLMTTEKTPTTFVITTGYSQETNAGDDSFKLKSLIRMNNNERMSIETTVSAKAYKPEVIKSFTVQSLHIVYEEELITEKWMTESFSTDIEPFIETECWMSKLFYHDMEECIETEEWMTVPLYHSSEEIVKVEEWMTVPLYHSSEKIIEVEEWMTVPFYASSEEIC